MKIDIRGGKIKNPRAKLNGSRGGGGGEIVLSTSARHS